MSNDQTTVISADLKDLTLAQLVQLSQGLGRQIDTLRAQRQHLKGHIDARLQDGERESASGDGDAAAPGAVIAASAKA